MQKQTCFLKRFFQVGFITALLSLSSCYDYGSEAVLQSPEIKGVFAAEPGGFIPFESVVNYQVVQASPYYSNYYPTYYPSSYYQDYAPTGYYVAPHDTETYYYSEPSYEYQEAPSDLLGPPISPEYEPDVFGYNYGYQAPDSTTDENPSDSTPPVQTEDADSQKLNLVKSKALYSAYDPLIDIFFGVLGFDTYYSNYYSDAYYCNSASALSFDSQVEVLEKPSQSQVVLLPFVMNDNGNLTWAFHPDVAGTYRLKVSTLGRFDNCGSVSSRTASKEILVEAALPTVTPFGQIEQVVSNLNEISLNLDAAQFAVISEGGSSFSKVFLKDANAAQEVRIGLISDLSQSNAPRLYAIFANGKTYRLPIYFSRHFELSALFGDANQDGIQELYLKYNVISVLPAQAKVQSQLPLFLKVGLVD